MPAGPGSVEPAGAVEAAAVVPAGRVVDSDSSPPPEQPDRIIRPINPAARFLLTPTILPGAPGREHRGMRLQHAYGWKVPMTLLGLGPSFSYIEVANGNLTVVLSWGFRMKAPLSEVESAERVEVPVPWKFGAGVHGWAGEWAVNAARRPHVVIRFAKPQRGYTVGFPVRVRVLHLCPAEPEQLLEALQPRV